MVGLETSDDAGVYRLTDDLALIQTLDFFTPIVDSPYDFGKIAAANALSDVYAMGGRPITAMNIVCFPAEDLPESVLKETLAGGLEKIHEAGAILVGGHSVDDVEFKYGLSVSGLVHPKDLLTNAGAVTGDRLILTKPIGTGILSTALKGKLANDASVNQLIQVSSTLNRYAAETAVRFRPSACTDITGFGLAGHVLEMARAAEKEIILYAEALPLIDGVFELASMGLFPAGAYKNKKFCKENVSIAAGIDPVRADLFFDPQTSGGLILSLAKGPAQECLTALHDQGLEGWIIGEVSTDVRCGHVTIR